jgi:hypothetical protein
MHELFHFAHFTHAPRLYLDLLETGLTDNGRDIANTISSYAATNLLETVAEIGTLLATNRQEIISPQAWDLYLAAGGPVPATLTARNTMPRIGAAPAAGGRSGGGAGASHGGQYPRGGRGRGAGYTVVSIGQYR